MSRAAGRVNSRAESNRGYAARTRALNRHNVRTDAAAARGARKAAARGASAVALGRAYVLFLVFISLATVLMCVSFLRMKQTLTAQSDRNTVLASQLSALRAENDALYADIEGSVDLSQVREEAVTRYGMKYATEDQLVWYTAHDTGFVRQYRDVPEG